MMHKSFKRQLVAGGMLLLSASAFSLPAQGVWQQGCTTDGRTVEVKLVGNEHFSYFEDEAGNYYRQDRSGRFASLTLWQVETQRQRANEQLAKLLQAKETEARAKASQGNGPLRHPRKAAQNQYKGQRRGMVVLVDFSDVPFQAGHDNAFYQRVFNEEGLDMGRYRRSVHDYFLEQSYGQFDLTFDVYGPYRLSQLSSWYGENVASGLGEREERHGLVAMHAAQAAIREIDDLSIYDWDGDRKVDQICVVYAGLGQSSGGTANDIWAHESSLTDIRSMYGSSNGSPVTHNGYTIDVYNICNELNKKAIYDASGKATFTNQILDSGIGVFCHEFGHCLGLPDFYASTGAVLGQFEIMDKGPQLDDYFQPAGYSAYERWFCGWLEPVELQRSRFYSNVKPLEQSGEAFVLYCDNPSGNEFYMFENRQRIGCDAAFPSAGLYVTRIDYSASLWQSNQPNESSHQRYVYIGANVLATNDVSKVCFPQGAINSISDVGIPRFQQYNGGNTLTAFMGHAVEAITQNDDGTVSFRYVNKNDPDPTFSYERDITAGRYGTLVLEYPIDRENLEGVKSLYTVRGYTNGTNGKPKALVIEEVDEDIVAGKPYIFLPEENATQLVAKSWSPASAAVNKPLAGQECNGLTGVFQRFTMNILFYNLFPDNYYMLSDNKLRSCAVGSYVEPNRAYFDKRYMPLLTEAQAAAIGGVAFGFDEGETLGIGSLEQGGRQTGTGQPDGDGQHQPAIFDLNGRRLTSPPKRGVFILNGRKVLGTPAGR